MEVNNNNTIFETIDLRHMPNDVLPQGPDSLRISNHQSQHDEEYDHDEPELAYFADESSANDWPRLVKRSIWKSRSSSVDPNSRRHLTDHRESEHADNDSGDESGDDTDTCELSIQEHIIRRLVNDKRITPSNHHARSFSSMGTDSDCSVEQTSLTEMRPRRVPSDTEMRITKEEEMNGPDTPVQDRAIREAGADSKSPGSVYSVDRSENSDGMSFCSLSEQWSRRKETRFPDRKRRNLWSNSNVSSSYSAKSDVSSFANEMDSLAVNDTSQDRIVDEVDSVNLVSFMEMASMDRGSSSIGPICEEEARSAFGAWKTNERRAVPSNIHTWRESSSWNFNVHPHEVYSHESMPSVTQSDAAKCTAWEQFFIVLLSLSLLLFIVLLSLILAKRNEI